MSVIEIAGETVRLLFEDTVSKGQKWSVDFNRFGDDIVTIQQDWTIIFFDLEGLRI